MKQIVLSDTTKRILANISWASLDKVIRLAGGLLVGTAVARYLGASEFGIFSFAYAIYAVCNIVSNLGLDLLVIKELTLEPELENLTLGTAFFLKVGASVITTLAAVVVAYLLKPHDLLIVKITTLLSVASIFQGFEVAGFFFQAKLKSRLTIIPTSVVFLLACGARVAAILSHSSLLILSWIAALEIALTQLCLVLRFAAYRKKLFSWRFDRERAISLLRGGWPLMTSSFLIVLYSRCDQIILGMYCNSAAVGSYSAAVRLVEVWYSLPLIVCGSVMPQLLKLKEKSWPEYSARLQELYNLMAIASLVVAILAMLFGKLTISIVFGNQYASAYPVLCIYIWSGLFVFVGIVGSQQMAYDGLAMIQLKRSFIGAVVNIILNLIIVPVYGAIGSAVATLIVQGIVSYGIDITNEQTRAMFRHKTQACSFLWLFNRRVLRWSVFRSSMTS